MKTDSLFAVYESCGNYDGSPNIVEVFIDKDIAETFLELKREELKAKWTEAERKKWRDKNLRKRDKSRTISEEEIEKIVENHIKTIDHVLHFSIQMDTLDKVIDKIREEIHDVYSSMGEGY